MIKILRDTSLEALEANINGIIREEYGMKIKDVRIEFHQGKDYMYNGEICNQWFEYIAVLIFENK